MNIPIVFEDDWLVILDKPTGLLTIPTPKNESRTLTSILNADLESRGLSYRLHPCHRLDRETSGLIIYAKGKVIQQKMMDLFKAKQVKKTYIAFVQGTLPRKEGSIKSSIDGTSAQTDYRVLEERNEFSLVEVMPLTGRTNQVRIHFKSIGHPLVGETKFAFRKDYKLRAKRVCLHAESVEFTHPITHQPMFIEADLAADLLDFLKKHP